jgi:uncharacterized protein
MGISSATWFITSKCNLDCEYCFTHFNKDFPQKDSTFETGKAIVDFLLINSTTPNVGISFFGGEPLLQIGLMKEVVVYAKERGKLARKNFNFSVTTNATLITEELIEWFKAVGISPLISLDGMPHEENKRLFGSGGASAEVALEKAISVLDAEIQPVIRWTVHPDSLSYLFNDVRRFIRLGFDAIALEPVYEVEWSKESLERYEDELRKISKLYLDYLRRGKNMIIKPIDDAIRLFVAEQKQKTRCGTATHGVGVDMDGNIYPCHRFVTRMGPVLGDVFTGWNEVALKQAQSWDVNKVHPEHGSCKDCPINLRCPGGGCLCVNLDLCNDIYTSPDLFCTFQKINQRVTNDIAFILYGEKNPVFMGKLEGKGGLRT